VVKTAVEISLGINDKLILGNLDSYRDWGHSYDYVRAMKLIINQNGPDDFVIATGQTHSVREMCEYVFNRLNLDYRDYVEINPAFYRPEELKYLKGDSTRARNILGWKPTFTFQTMLDDMIHHWQKELVVKRN
jgi:GDPmannose 4,6-dehydratase